MPRSMPRIFAINLWVFVEVKRKLVGPDLFAIGGPSSMWTFCASASVLYGAFSAVAVAPSLTIWRTLCQLGAPKWHTRFLGVVL